MKWWRRFLLGSMIGVLASFGTPPEESPELLREFELLLSSSNTSALVDEVRFLVDFLKVDSTQLANVQASKLLQIAREQCSLEGLDSLRRECRTEFDNYALVYQRLRRAPFFRSRDFLDFTEKYQYTYDPFMTVSKPAGIQFNLAQLAVLLELLQIAQRERGALKGEKDPAVEFLFFQLGRKFSTFLWQIARIEWTPTRHDEYVDRQVRFGETFQNLGYQGARVPLDGEFLALYKGNFDRGVQSYRPPSVASFLGSTFVSPTLLELRGLMFSFFVNLGGLYVLPLENGWAIAARVLGLTTLSSFLLSQFQYRGHRWIDEGTHGPWILQVSEPAHRHWVARDFFRAGCTYELTQAGNKAQQS